MKKVIALVTIMATVFACSVSAAATTTGKYDGEYSYVTVDGSNYFVEGNVKDGIDKYISATSDGDSFFETSKEIESLSAENGYFIPYGFVKSSDKYIKKDVNGNFAKVPANQKFKQYKLPEPITTFGVSHSENDNDKDPIFGSYAVNLSTGAKYGTMLMVGKWDAFSAWALSKDSGKTTADLIARVSALYDDIKSKNTSSSYVGLKWTDDSSTVNVLKVYKTPQNNWMWKNETAIQYAVKAKGLEISQQCVAVGYFTDNDTTSFSGEIKCYTMK